MTVTSLAGFERVFGGLWPGSPLGYAVADFFRHGGSVAVVVRAHAPGTDDTALLTLGDAASGELVLRAASPGAWGSHLVARSDADGRLVVSDTGSGRLEVLSDLARVDVESDLVRVVSRPARLGTGLAATTTPAAGDGGSPDPAAYGRAFAALRQADLINLLVVPGDLDPDVSTAATALAEERRAIFLRDPPEAWTTAGLAVAGATAAVPPRSPNAAVYFPRIRQPGPLRGPSGAVAGVIARNDVTRGVWKSPAGVEAELEGVSELDVAVNDRDGARLNPLGVNALRSFPGTGPVVWGARTSDGTWYLAIRRTALFLAESLERGTRWATFEANDEALWARLRTEVAAFLDDLFRRGAFAGATPQDAYLVKCDGATTTRADVERGLVNVTVGFAPLKPAEFVVIQLQQLAGHTPHALTG